MANHNENMLGHDEPSERMTTLALASYAAATPAKIDRAAPTTCATRRSERLHREAVEWSGP